MELVIVIVLTMLMVPLVVFTEGALRITLGLLFLLFFPGYTLVAAIFPKKDSLDTLERIALSFALSLAVVPLIGFILNYVWRVDLYPIIISVGVFIFLASVIALSRRLALPETQRFKLSLHIEFLQWNRLRGLEKAMLILLVFLVIGTIGSLVYVLAVPRAGERSTELYTLDQDGNMTEYTLELVVGEEALVNLVIVNHEHRETMYHIEIIQDHVEVRINGEEVQEINNITLSDEQEWQTAVTLIPLQAGEQQKVEFLLYKSEVDSPYRTNYILLDVGEAP